MSFFNDAQRDALFTGRYICSECGGLMEFEDEYEDILVCPACGHSVELEHYGFENKDPCNDCLAEPNNINSHRPIRYENKNKK